MTWILTREAADAADDGTALGARGITFRSVPCVEFLELPWPAWQRDARVPLTFLTSKRAARRYVEAKETTVVAAISPSTSAYLLEHGVRVDHSARGGVMALAETLLHVQRTTPGTSWNVHYPTSTAGLESAEQEEALSILSELGPVQRVPVYETRAPRGLSDRLAPVTSEPWCVAFWSPSAVSGFLSAVAAGAVAPDHVVCHGRSTERSWNQHRPSHWREAVFTSNVVDTVVSLEELKS